MKTLINTLSLVLALTFALTISTYASNNPESFEEETYIDDIPFSTETVVFERDSIDFDEEVFIEDIPFSTKSVASVHSYDLATSETFEFEAEDTIDDIPFNTSIVAQNTKAAYSKKLTAVN